MNAGEKWTRGAGTGIGTSGHINIFSNGVLISNWREDGATIAAGETSAPWPVGDRQTPMSTTQARPRNYCDFIMTYLGA